MQDDVGLCRACRHARQVPTPRALYWRCTLAETNARFERYPRLPVLECDGYDRATPGGDPEREVQG